MCSVAILLDCVDAVESADPNRREGGDSIRNIVFARIDERLLHGQVVTAWVAASGCNVIYVIDDTLAKNAMMVALYKKLAPRGTTCHLLSTDKAVELLLSEPSDSKEKIMLLVKVPQVLEKLIDAGVRIESINLGGMGLNKGREVFIENVSASPEEIESMRRIIKKGIPIIYRISPHSKPVDVKGILESRKNGRGV